MELGIEDLGGLAFVCFFFLACKSEEGWFVCLVRALHCELMNPG